MRRLGLSIVRVGEFAWSRLEDADGTLHLDWMQRALDTLHAEGLSVVLGTPTATPPAWLLRKYPDMLAVDEHGRQRGFGSRRHYCFSHRPYREECARIVTVLAERFGEHPAVVAWQTDNEYGCHDTALSYSAAAVAAFRQWCRERYGSIARLNEAWGNVFWSMEYPDFEAIDAPVGAVTETNPSHRLAYWRFASDEIKSFDQLQVEILRRLSPGRDVSHNFMGNFVEFDHHLVAQHLDIATWDNYPLGFLTRDGVDAEQQQRYLRTGSPDGSAFHHDLYRGCGNGRFWVMEQQPGPVNWAPYNPAPIDGMPRLWAWEAFAHGAEVVSWFRWRQAPFAQEQMHTGLLLSNGEPDDAAADAAQVAEEIQALVDAAIDLETRKAPVALIFDYTGDRLQRLQETGVVANDPLLFTQEVYAAVRCLGLNIDVVSSDADLSDYRLILLPNATVSDEALVARLDRARKQHGATVVLFARTGSRTVEGAIPETLPPGAFQALIPVAVTRSESLPPSEQPVAMAPGDYPVASVQSWRERLRTDLVPRAYFDDGWGYHYADNGVHYINGMPTPSSLRQLVSDLCIAAELRVLALPEGLRTRRRGAVRFAFNVGAASVMLDDYFGRARGGLLFGERELAPGGVAAWYDRG